MLSRPRTTPLVFALLAIASVAAAAWPPAGSTGNTRQGFAITGRIEGLADGVELVLRNLGTGATLDRSVVTAGSFSFRGVLTEEPEELRIITSTEWVEKGMLHYTDLLIGNENVSLVGHVDELPRIRSSGSVTQSEAESYREALHVKTSAVEQARVALDSIDADSAPDEQERAHQRLATVQAEVESWRARFVAENFDTYIGLLVHSYHKNLDHATLKRLFQELPAEMKASRLGQAVATEVAYPTPQVGDTFHDLEGLDDQGQTVLLSDLTDGWTLLQFASEGCYGSRLAVEAMKTLTGRYGEAVRFISFSTDSRARWLRYVGESRVTWGSLWQEGGRHSEAFGRYGVTGTPTFFLIAPGGEVVATWFGHSDGKIEEEIERAFDQRS
ncbi:MAG: redoxin domain-containing protein [Thermoanaerobaculia bacterium]|nr:redoxin domain-containing protein [Thermoanaerobaculia bacterium]